MKARVLVVDDENSIRVTLREFLRETGYAVDVSEDADEALARLSAQAFDVVVSDVIMPRTTGVALLKAIKEASPNVQVILMTGEPTVETASEAVREGACDYLAKPIGKQLFLRAVANAAKIKSLNDDRRRLTTENRRYREHLESLVAERTAALAESEELLKATGRTARVGGWQLDAKTLEVSWTEETYRIHELPLGMSPPLEDAINFYAPEEQPRMEAAVARALTHGDPFDMELRFITAKGTRLWVHAICSPIVVDGQVTKLRGTFQDVTARKNSERELYDSEARSRAILEGSPVWNKIIDLESRLTYMSAAGTQMLKAPDLAPLMGGTFPPDFYPEEARACLTENLDIALAGEKSECEGYLRDMRGGDVWFHTTFTPVLDRRGRIQFVLGTSVDITTRKRAENERERAQAGMARAYEEIRTLKERLEAENVLLRKEVQLGHRHGNIAGESRALLAALAEAEHVAPTDASVLLLGETGTGKELFAHAIHRMSSRAAGPMIVVNCAAMPETLMEHELFGSEAGAFTGALKRSIGRFEAADGGTIFLDEIGELAPSVQVKLLRVLEDGGFERLGSSETRHADVRVIAATNSDLEERVKDGAFRADLFYRLDVYPITLPPLRDREGDIALLAEVFTHAIAEKMGKRIDSLTQAGLDRLAAHDWPGNVRELRNVIERALIGCRGTVLDIELHLRPAVPGRHRRPGATSMADVEREHLLQVLERTLWRVRGRDGAAELLKLKPSTLESRMRKHGIRRPPA